MQCQPVRAAGYNKRSMAGRKDLNHEWRRQLKKLSWDHPRDIRVCTLNPRRNDDLHLNTYDSLKARVIDPVIQEADLSASSSSGLHSRRGAQGAT